MAIVKSGDFTFAFPTLVLRRVLPDVDAMNDALRELILQERARHPGIVRSNVGSWHSSLEFFARPEPALDAFRGRLRDAVHEYWRLDQQVSRSGREVAVRVTGWAMVYETGGYAAPHAHPNANYSGVYYVDDGAPPPGGGQAGALSLLDPRSGSANFSTSGVSEPTSLDIPAETGKLVVFPSWLQHYVHPHRGARPRVALSFNVQMHDASTDASASHSE